MPVNLSDRPAACHLPAHETLSTFPLPGQRSAVDSETGSRLREWTTTRVSRPSGNVRSGHILRHANGHLRGLPTAVTHRRQSSVGVVVGWLCSRRRSVAARPDRGAATAELVIAMPLLLGILMFIVQAGVYLHAIHIAQAAATRAASVAAAYGASASQGEEAGRTTLDAIGHSVLVDPTVAVTRTATEVRVEVEGTAQTVVPGVHWQVRAVVVRPTERFVPGSAL
ncbi:MAG: pilus assembly protein [Micromonosporaceae bacterium]|nr:pilus assembly protein [Micromonosporaceae bacterium]